MYTQIILLLFGLRSLTAHIIAKVELQNGTDVYEVKELANDTVEFTNPKAKEPTLREIIYYRVIEKPYIEDDKVKAKESNENEDIPLEFEESARPFTNTHGYQFVDWGQLEDVHQTTKEDAQIVTSTRGDDHDDHNDEDDNDSDEEENSIEKMEPSIDDDNDTTDETNPANSENADVVDHYNNTDLHNGDEPKGDDNDKTDKKRNNLFDAIKLKYQSMKKRNNESTEIVRRKREINYQNIPSAPILPDLDLHAFPDYIQKILANRPSLDNDNSAYHKSVPNASVNKDLTIQKNEKQEEKSEEYDDGESRKRLQNNGRPLEREKLNVDLINKSKEDIDKFKDRFEDANRISPLHDRSKLRTYGMSLKGDKGEIWNDITGLPHIIINNFGSATSQHSSKFDNDGVKYKPNAINDFINTKNHELENNHNNNNFNRDLIEPEKELYNVPSRPTVPDNSNEYNQEIQHPTSLKPDTSHYLTQQQSSPPVIYTTTPEQQYIDTNAIKHKIRKSFDAILSQLSPFKPISKVSDITIEFNNFENKDNDVPKTYGMNLTGDHGYVWNDITKPGSHYNIGESVTSDTINLNNIEPATDATVEENKTENPTSETPICETATATEVTLDYEKDKEIAVTTENFVETTTMDVVKTSTQFYEETTRTPNIESTNEANKKNDDSENCNKENNKADEKLDDKESLNLSLDELLKKDEFWDWLSKWTKTYLEVLNEHIEKLVKDEVAKELKKKCNETEKDKDSVSNNTLGDERKDKKHQTDNLDKNTLENNKTNANSNENITESVPSTENNITDECKNKTDHEQKKQKEELSTKNNTNQIDHHKSVPPYNITADTIYGSIVGNDHVTNIFIFYPNDKTNETLKSIINDSTILGKPVNEGDEKKNLPVTNEPEDSSNTETNTTESYKLDKDTNQTPKEEIEKDKTAIETETEVITEENVTATPSASESETVTAANHTLDEITKEPSVTESSTPDTSKKSSIISSTSHKTEVAENKTITQASVTEISTTNSTDEASTTELSTSNDDVSSSPHTEENTTAIPIEPKEDFKTNVTLTENKDSLNVSSTNPSSTQSIETSITDISKTETNTLSSDALKSSTEKADSNKISESDKSDEVQSTIEGKSTSNKTDQIDVTTKKSDRHCMINEVIKLNTKKLS